MNTIKNRWLIWAVAILSLSMASGAYAKIGWDLGGFAEDTESGSGVVHHFKYEEKLQSTQNGTNWVDVEGATQDPVSDLTADKIERQIDSIGDRLGDILNQLEVGTYRLLITVSYQNSQTKKPEKLLYIHPTFTISAGAVTDVSIGREDIDWYDTFYYTSLDSIAWNKKYAETPTAEIHTVPRVKCDERAAAIEQIEAKIGEYEGKTEELYQGLIEQKRKEIASYLLMDYDGDDASYESERDKGTKDCPSNREGADSKDFDGDGLSDGQEISLGTSPTNKDHDADGISDGLEVNGFEIPGISGLLVKTNPAVLDTDGDTRSDGEERNADSVIKILINGKPKVVYSNPSKGETDTDKDGRTDSQELASWQVSIGGVMVDIRTDPMNKNTDAELTIKGRTLKDSFTDKEELDGVMCKNGKKIVMNPAKTDTDEDGLSDSDECLNVGTDPTNKDSDKDGLTDGEEINGTFDEAHTKTNPLKDDSDGDKILDQVEFLNDLNPNKAELVCPANWTELEPAVKKLVSDYLATAPTLADTYSNEVYAAAKARGESAKTNKQIKEGGELVCDAPKRASSVRINIDLDGEE